MIVHPDLVPAREPGPGENEGPPVTTSEDVRTINRRLAERRQQYGAYRIHRAFFRCEWPCTQKHYEAVRYGATAKWIADQEKRGWVLRSKVYVNTAMRRPAHGYRGDLASGVLLDQVEIPVQAVFEKENPRPVRFEIPVAS